MSIFNRRTESPLKVTQWLPFRRRYKEDIDRLLDTEAGKRAFDESFVDRILARKSEIEKRANKTTLINTAILAALFLNVFILPTDLSLAGLSAHDIGKLKEILLFVSATLTVFSSLMYAELQFIGDIGRACAERKHGPELAKYAALPFGTLVGETWFLIPKIDATRLPTRMTLVAIYGLMALILLSVTLYFVASISVYLTIIVDVIRRPSLPPMFAWPIIFYAAVASVVQILYLVVRWVPLPYDDYSLAFEMAELSKRAPDLHRERLAELTKKQFK